MGAASVLMMPSTVGSGVMKRDSRIVSPDSSVTTPAASNVTSTRPRYWSYSPACTMFTGAPSRSFTTTGYTATDAW